MFVAAILFLQLPISVVLAGSVLYFWFSISTIQHLMGLCTSSIRIVCITKMKTLRHRRRLNRQSWKQKFLPVGRNSLKISRYSKTVKWLMANNIRWWVISTGFARLLGAIIEFVFLPTTRLSFYKSFNVICICRLT